MLIRLDVFVELYVSIEVHLKKKTTKTERGVRVCVCVVHKPVLQGQITKYTIENPLKDIDLVAPTTNLICLFYLGNVQLLIFCHL